MCCQRATCIAGDHDFATCFNTRDAAADVAIHARRGWRQITKAGRVLNQTCTCRQPIMIFECGGPHITTRGLDCYAIGFEFPDSAKVQPV
ncbi:MAG: hypothetical protein ABI832_23245 [bacterium]